VAIRYGSGDASLACSRCNDYPRYLLLHIAASKHAESSIESVPTGIIPARFGKSRDRVEAVPLGSLANPGALFSDDVG
jgi:hypothetical protein